MSKKTNYFESARREGSNLTLQRKLEASIVCVCVCGGGGMSFVSRENALNFSALWEFAAERQSAAFFMFLLTVHLSITLV